MTGRRSRLRTVQTERGAFRALVDSNGRLWWVDNPYPPEQVVRMIGPLYVGPPVRETKPGRVAAS